jgi:hypothetical protein
MYDSTYWMLGNKEKGVLEIQEDEQIVEETNGIL